MSTNQETMRTSIKTAESSKKDTAAAAVTAALTTVTASGTGAGYVLGSPTNAAAYVAAVASANKTLGDSRYTAEMTKQASVAVAKDLLRSQGEIPF